MHRRNLTKRVSANARTSNRIVQQVLARTVPFDVPNEPPDVWHTCSAPLCYGPNYCADAENAHE